MIGLLGDTDDERALAGDQLYVDLDLSHDNLPAGSRIEVGDDVVLEVTAKPHAGLQEVPRPVRRGRGRVRQQRGGQPAPAARAECPRRARRGGPPRRRRSAGLTLLRRRPATSQEGHRLTRRVRGMSERVPVRPAGPARPSPSGVPSRPHRPPTWSPYGYPARRRDGDDTHPSASDADRPVLRRRTRGAPAAGREARGSRPPSWRPACSSAVPPASAARPSGLRRTTACSRLVAHRHAERRLGRPGRGDRLDREGRPERAALGGEDQRERPRRLRLRLGHHPERRTARSSPTTTSPPSPGNGGQMSVDFNDGSHATAKVLGTDPLTDTAVIQAEGV